MQQTSDSRLRVKYLLTKYMSSSLVDKLRNTQNLRHKFLYDRRLQRKILHILKKYDCPVESNLDLLKALHKEFKIINLSDNYKFRNW